MGVAAGVKEKMSGRLKGRSRFALVLFFLVVGLVLALFIASIFGTVMLSLPDVVKMTLDKVPFIDLQDTWRVADEIIFIIMAVEL